MAKELPIIRTSVQVYPVYVEECSLQAANFSELDQKCRRNTGINAGAMVLLATLLQQHFQFQFVKYRNTTNNFPQLVHQLILGEVNMSLDLWTINEIRHNQVRLTLPLLYYKEVVIVSAKAFTGKLGSVEIIPFDKLSFTLICVSVLTFIVFDSAKVIIEERQRLTLRRILRIVYAASWDIINFSDTTIARLGMIASLVYVLSFVALISQAYSSFMKGTMIRTSRPPFRNMNELVAQLNKNEHVLLADSDPDNAFIHALHSTGKLRPNFTYVPYENNRKETIRALQMVAQNPKYVLPTSSLAAAFLLHGLCSKYRVITMSDGDLGMSVALHRDVARTYVETFERTIAEVQAMAQSMIEDALVSAPGGGCMDSYKGYAAQSMVLNLDYFQPLFSIYCGLLCMCCIAVVCEIFARTHVAHSYRN